MQHTFASNPKESPTRAAPPARPTLATGRPVLQRKCACGGPPGPGGECVECRKKREGTLQRRASGPEPDEVPAIVHEVLRSPGQPLDPATRAFMEPRFSHDFSQVRVHTDKKAAESACAMNAMAYTVGRDVVFGVRQYSPNSAGGRNLLAHELAHTIQQEEPARNETVTRRPLSIGAWGDKFERNAERVADLAISNEPGGVASRALTPGPSSIQRKPVDENENSAKSKPVQTDAPPASEPRLDIEFDAYIPGSIGNSFASCPHPADLKNQSAFESTLKAVKGTWLEEPGSFTGFNTGPWYFATDNREKGGGSHRLGFTGSVERSQIGKLGGEPRLFEHTTSGSERVRWVHSGYFTSKEEVGSVEGPHAKSAIPTHSEERADTAAGESFVTTQGSANYPFNAASPTIDYRVVFNLKRATNGKTRLQFEIMKNLFPYYELLINRKSIWAYSASDTGPSVVNLNRSDTFKSGDLFF